MKIDILGARAPATRTFPVAGVDAKAAEALRWERWVCLSAVVGVLVVAAMLFWYAHPLADDFARAYKGRAQGVISATINEHFSWTGRWASCILSYILASSFDLVRFYPVLLGINTALLAISVYALLQAAEIGDSRRERLALTSSALALYWAGMPHPGENIYWLTGSVDNLAGLAVSLLLMAGLLHCPMQGTSIPVARRGAGLGVVAMLATGFHELFALLLCIALTGGTLRAWLARDQRRWIWGACLVAAVAGFLAVYTAPGSAARQAEFPLAGNLGTTMRLMLQQGAANLVPWILDIRLFTGTALLLMLAPGALTSLGHSRNTGTARDVGIVALTWIVAVGAAFAAASWGIGMKLPPRTLDGIYLVFLTGWFWVLVMLTRLFAERKEPLIVATPLMRRVTVVIFVAAMLLTGNTRKALLDLRWAAPAYSAAMQRRWHALNAARDRGEQDAVLKPLPARPQSYASFELHEDPEYWENWGVAHYFGLRTVRIESKAEEPH